MQEKGKDAPCVLPSLCSCFMLELELRYSRLIIYNAVAMRAFTHLVPRSPRKKIKNLNNPCKKKHGKK